MSRDPKRIARIGNRFVALWALMPDMRFGQMVAYVQSTIPGADPDAFYIEDDKWESAIEQAILTQQEIAFSTKSIKG